MRDDWLRAGLSTQPADTATAEAVVTELYRLLGQPKPAFEWVPSPAAALRTGASRPGFRPGRLGGRRAPATGRDWPTAARLASLLSDLRGRLDDRIGQAQQAVWRRTDFSLPRPPSPGEILDAAVHDSLAGTLRDAICAPLRISLPGLQRGALGLTWYGQQDAWWIARHDAWRRAGLVPGRPADAGELDLWGALARSTGWWWPGQHRCVMAGRPAALHTEPAPASEHGQLRLHRDDGPAIAFADGYWRHVLHGTPVPAWVVTGPTVEAIHREPNIEVRRTAIERIGWDAYLDQARLSPVAARPDPGNPGSRLRLYDLPAAAGGRPARFLLAVNGSPEPDGRHRQYGLTVPADIDDPVAAAAWTYGLTGAQYAQLARRT
ncbi:MAG: DUF6745 domain-containing protein [Streptosporangiaceae bacterium]